MTWLHIPQYIPKSRLLMKRGEGVKSKWRLQQLLGKKVSLFGYFLGKSFVSILHAHYNWKTLTYYDIENGHLQFFACRISLQEMGTWVYLRTFLQSKPRKPFFKVLHMISIIVILRASQILKNDYKTRFI